MKYLSHIIVAALFLLFLAVPPTYAQEEAVEEEAVEVQEEAVEEAVEVQEEAVEEAVEEVVEEAEAVEEEAVEEEFAEVEAEEEYSPLAGYTAGLNVGYPVITGEYFKDQKGPVIGLVVGSPFGLPIGPFNVGVGAGLEAAMMGDHGTEIGFFAVVNTSVYVTPRGPISLYGGLGLYGGIGIIGGASLDYSVPNMPLVVKPYLRGTLLSSVTEGSDKPSYFISIGAMFSYDISTLF